MKISKTWHMPSAYTFTIKPIKKLLDRHIRENDYVIDAFANNSKIATVTNDISPLYDTDYHMDALDFLKMFDTESVDVVLYDPPYSLGQIAEHYKGVGRKVTQEMTQSSWRARHLDEISRILKPGGKAICFGWNSAGVGKKRGFKTDEILLVSHGGSKNDTICVVDIKEQTNEHT